MFEIYGYTYRNKEIKRSALDGDYAINIFNSMLQAEDAESVVIADGSTGEIILKWERGKVIYIKDVGFDEK